MPSPLRASQEDRLATLFDLGRRVTSVLQLDELLETIPELVARVITYDAFAVYLLDRKRGDLRIAYPVGYPENVPSGVRLAVGEGLVGTAVQRQEPLLINDVTRDLRYKRFVPGMSSAIVVPLIYKGRVIGALNVLSHLLDAYDEDDVAMLRQFGVHVAVALENARLFEQERRDARVFETLAEIGREVSSVLDLDELLTRIAQLTKRVINYRTLGILLVNEAGTELEMKLAVQYGDRVGVPRIRIGEGLVGYAALHKEPVLVGDVLNDPRYLRFLDDVRSELVVPLLNKGVCLGVIDLENPELDAFDTRDVQMLTVLASQAAVAIENARLYEAVRANEDRLDREVSFAQRVQMALLPHELPKRFRGVDVASRFRPARELGGDFYDYMSAEPQTLVVAVGDVSGKGVPAALYSAFAAELVRSRTFRRRYTPERATPAAVLSSVNSILHQRELEEYYLTLCYAAFDFKRRSVVMANSGLPFPIHSSEHATEAIPAAGLPLGSFPESTYDEVSFALTRGDVFVFFSDGVTDAMNEEGDEFGASRVIEIVARTRTQSAREIVDAIASSVESYQGRAAQFDDMTIVAVKITA